MKKIILIIMLIASMLTLTSTVSAAEVTYKNLVTDESTIEEDFKLLGMDINEYYIPKTYNYQKWYVVAMSESYNADKTIQTYFYLYNPTIYWYQPELTLTYVINGVQKNFVCSDFLEVDNSRGLHKIKGFLYDYCKDVKICINNIKHFYENDQDDINSGFVETYLFNSISTFEANNEHSLASQSISMDLNFNSTIIIEDYNVVRVVVKEDDNFINGWKNFWDCEEEYLNLYFYNFNFPDHIEYDSVEYAKFKYDYVYYSEVVFDDYGIDKRELNRVQKINEYNNETREIQVNDTSQKVYFDIFHLGNRVIDGQFIFDSSSINLGSIDYFDVDCSILLDSTYITKESCYGVVYDSDYPDLYDNYGSTWYTYDLYHSTFLDDIEFLELHYMNDGILYKCQIVTPPVDSSEVEAVPPVVDSKEDSPWNQFINWFMENFPYSLLLILGIIIAIILLCIFAPHLVFGALKGIISLIVYIFTLPIKLIKLIFKRE